MRDFDLLRRLDRFFDLDLVLVRFLVLDGLFERLRDTLRFLRGEPMSILTAVRFDEERVDSDAVFPELLFWELEPSPNICLYNSDAERLSLSGDSS